MKVLVMPDKYKRAWNGDNATINLTVAWPLHDVCAALQNQYDTDAHFAPYWVEDTETMPRLKRGAIERLERMNTPLRFGIGLLDIDAPDHRDGVPEGWREEMEDKISSLEQEQGVSLSVYHTRGGCRVLWRLPEPLGVEAYIAMLGSARRVAARHDIEADELTDWQRLYRFPFVVRDGVQMNLPHRNLDALEVWNVPVERGAFAGMDEEEPFELPAVIRAGSRHQTLVRYAASLRARGVDIDGIREQVTQAAHERCVPPMNDPEEINQIIIWVDTLPEPEEDGEDGLRLPDIILERNSEASIARWMIEHWPQRLVSDAGDLWEYVIEKGIWQRAPRHEWDAVLNQIDQRGFVPGRRGLTPICINLNHFKNVRQTAMRLATDPGFFNGGQVGIAFRDRYLYVDVDGTVEWREHSPDNRATRYRDWVYDPQANPERFLKMLRDICSNGLGEVNEAKVRCILEFIGVAILGHSTAMQKVLVLLGSGGNGKSQILDVVSGIFEAHERVCVSPQNMGNEYRRYTLLGAAINLISEVASTVMRAQASAAFKSIVAGDEIEGRHIREMPVTFSPRAGHIMSANSLWMIEDESDGMFRRLMVLKLSRRFDNTPERVRDLGKHIAAEEYQAIFDVCIRHGIEALQRGEYTLPEDSKTEVEEWQRSQNPVAEWVHEDMEKVSARTEGTLAGELYACYQTWAEINGQEQVSSTMFGRRLKAMKIEKHKGERGNQWGLRPARRH